MKTFEPAPKFLIYALVQAIRHPRTSITYGYCSDCKVRVPDNTGECLVCKKKLKENRKPSKSHRFPGGIGVELATHASIGWGIMSVGSCLVAIGGVIWGKFMRRGRQ